MRLLKPMVAAACLLAACFFAEAEGAQAADGRYSIVGLSFQIEGRTQEAALVRALEADGPFVGARFPSAAELASFVESRRRALANNRVLGSVDYSIDYGEPEGGAAVVTFFVADTNNIVVLPEPSYDSNAGLSLTLKGRDYDFLGSMQSLELDLGFTSESTESRYFGGQTNFVLPFRALGSEMSLGFYENGSVWLGGSVASATAASLGYAVPGLGFPLSLKAVSGYAFSGNGGSNAAASLIARASLPLGLRLGNLGELRLSPELSASYGRWPDGSVDFRSYDGLAARGSAGAEVGRIDWVGNLQRGTVLRATATGTEYFASSDFVAEAELDYEAHWAFGEQVGLSGRLVALGRPLGAFPADDIADLGSYLRGIADARISGRAGAFLNLSVPLKLFDFPTHALIGKDILDFELQAAPFVDAAYVLADGPWCSAGLELLVFPKAFRSFIVRASFGYDLLRAASAGDYGPYEIHVGTGLFLDPVKTNYEEWVEK
jgi:hypothetical protein